MATQVATPQPTGAAGTANPQVITPGTTETELFRQSYSLPIPKNVEGIKEICTPTEADVKANADNKDLKAGEFNEDICTRIFRAGLRQLSNNALRAETTALDEKGNPKFSPVDGVFDARALLFRKPGREFMSERETLEANLRENPAMTDAAIAQILTIWDAQVGAETGNTSVSNNEVRIILQQTTGKDGKVTNKLLMKVPTKKDKSESEDEAAA